MNNEEPHREGTEGDHHGDDHRAASTEAIAAAFAEQGKPPAVAPDHLASAMIALDIGLAIQHFADPDAVPLELYPSSTNSCSGDAAHSYPEG
jgi:hypothetical protein